jgi:hypothetical protein
VRNAERKALDALGLEADASAQEMKTRFKALVKRHHPDANVLVFGRADRTQDTGGARGNRRGVRIARRAKGEKRNGSGQKHIGVGGGS